MFRPMLPRVSAAVFCLALMYVPAAAQRITKISAPALELKAGGPAASLVVEGTELDAVLSAIGIQSGLGVNGLTATISRRTATSMTLDIRATAAVLAGAYQLEMQSGAQKLGVPFAITVGRDDSTLLSS